MIQKTILAIVSVLILSACAPSEASIQTAVAQTQTALPTSTVVPTSTTIPTATIEPTATADAAANRAYLAALQSNTSAFLSAYSAFQAEFQEAVEDTNLLFDVSWRSRMDTATDALIDAAAELDSITPVPPDFEILNGHLQQISSETRLMVLSFQLFLAGDPNQADAIIEHSNKLSEYIQLANDEMDKHIP